MKLKANDYVLDIASNDATLLNFYKKNIITVGVDPLVNKYRNCYNNLKLCKFKPFYLNKFIKNQGKISWSLLLVSFGFLSASSFC